MNATTLPVAAAPLPVLGILNNAITVTNYVNAVQNAALPSSITSDSTYSQLCTDFANWQEAIWIQYYEGLVDTTLLAQAEQIYQLTQEDQPMPQSAFASVVNPPDASAKPAVIPEVVSQCDDVATQIAQGSGYVQQLQATADAIQNADKSKLAALDKIVKTLNNQFDKLEQQLTDKAIDASKEVVVTFIEVAVDVADEKDPVKPLAKAIAQVGIDIIEELMLSQEILDTLGELETAWQALDAETLQLAQLRLIIQRLDLVVKQSSKAISALNGIANEWQSVCDVINGPAHAWKNGGLACIKAWATRMNSVSFAIAPVQTVSS